MEDKQVEFVEKNYTTISQLIELRNKYHKVMEQRGKEILEEIFPTSRISTRVESWPNGPAIRFYSDKWSGDSNIVIHGSGSTDASGMQVHMYTNAIPKDEVIPPNAIDTGLTSWQEQAGKWRCWRTNERWFDHRTLLQNFRKLASGFDCFLQERQSN
jgi:hypothetical protein